MIRSCLRILSLPGLHTYRIIEAQCRVMGAVAIIGGTKPLPDRDQLIRDIEDDAESYYAAGKVNNITDIVLSIAATSLV